MIHADPMNLRPKRTWRRAALILASFLTVVGIVAGYLISRRLRGSGYHFILLRQYWSDPEGHADWILKGAERCQSAPFLMPSDGFVAFFYGDRYPSGRKHQGVDIFGPTGPAGIGETPIYAAYDGYLSRLPDWRSSLILRVPQDPLQPDRQIWLYYTHMADPQGRSFIQEEFPPGTFEVFVPAGSLLGFQGNYSADPDNPTGMHLHFSIVLDDGNGSFRNELEIRNTLDPSPYLGVELNGERIGMNIARCEE